MSNVIETGVIGTGALLAANVKPDIDQYLKLLEPYQKPFANFLLLSKKKSKVVTNPYAKFSWFEQQFYPSNTSVKAAISLTGVTLVLTTSNVTDPSIFGLKDIVICEETNQMAYVSSVTAGGGSDVVLTHMDGSTTLTALTTGVGYNIRVIGTRTFEYDGRTDYKSLQEVEVYNYLNEFKRYVTTSGRQQAGKAWTDGKTHAERVAQKTKEMQLEIERYLFFANARGYATSGNNRTTWGYGLDGYLSSNVTPYTGAVTEAQWRGYLQPVMEKGSGKKVHFCGSNQMNELEMLMRDYLQMQLTPKSLAIFEEFGASYKTYRMFSGTVTLVWDPVLDGQASNSGYTLDEEYVMMRYMDADEKGSRKFRVRSNTQDPDSNGSETEILSDVAIQLEHESAHGKFYKA